jgi:hypothetical protein
VSKPKQTTDVANCARCGGRHNKLKLKQFTNPVRDDQTDVIFTHYAPCPKMGQPILVLLAAEENP